MEKKIKKITIKGVGYIYIDETLTHDDLIDWAKAFLRKNKYDIIKRDRS